MEGTWRTTAVYAAAHFAVDLGCAYAVFSACRAAQLGFLVYNFCAFALQMPLGLLADRLGRGRWLAVSGALLVALVCCLPSFGLGMAAVLGLGNGLFHVGGGLDMLDLSGPKAAPLGVFVSPGALGLYCGTLLGRMGARAWPVAALLLLLCAAMAICCRGPLPDHPAPALPGIRVLPMAAALFLVVILRSYGGMAAAFSWKTGLWSLWAVLAVVLGKTLGGFAADRFGAGRTAAASLLLAAALFLLSRNPYAGTAALFLFNMTMPITLWALAQAMPGCKGFSFGILTFALFLGFLPAYLGAGSTGGLGMAAVALVSAALLAPCLRKRL